MSLRGNASLCNWPPSADVYPSAFMGRLRAKAGIITFGLPTEAAWEYACRAETPTALDSGKNIAIASSDANMGEA